MGVLKKFEQRLEGLVNGTFAKVFKSEVQPVEIAGALQRECDNNASIWNRERTVVPNDFIVELSPHDHERLSPYSGQLGNELAGMVREYAEAQRYSFMGPLQVNLEKADDLDTGLYRVRSRTLAAEEPQQQAPAQPTQPGYGRPCGRSGPRRAVAAGRRPVRRAPAATGRAPRDPAHADGAGRPRRRQCAPLPGRLPRHLDAPLDRGERRPPPDLRERLRARPLHRGGRPHRRPRSVPQARRDPPRNPLDGAGPGVDERHRGGRAAHPARYAPRRLSNRRGLHHHRLPTGRRVERARLCQN